MFCGRDKLCIGIASLLGVQAGSIAPLRGIILSILTLETVSAILVYGYKVVISMVFNGQICMKFGVCAGLVSRVDITS